MAASENVLSASADAGGNWVGATGVPAKGASATVEIGRSGAVFPQEDMGTSKLKQIVAALALRATRAAVGKYSIRIRSGCYANQRGISLSFMTGRSIA